MESIRIASTEYKSEIEIDGEIERLMDDPQNAFLHNKINQEKIDQADTSFEQLNIIKGLIDAKLEMSFKIKPLGNVEGVNIEGSDFKDVRLRVENIKKNQKKIGEGGDAIVVIDKTEIAGLPNEACYKLSKNVSTIDGKNPTLYEAEVQGDFHKIALEQKNSLIGVPEPFYSAEYGQVGLIVMEKLPAVSIKDIAERKGIVPDWFDIEKFVADIKGMMKIFHDKGLFHRDLHHGNIMISQSTDVPVGHWGYVIDFGYSGYCLLGEDPYKKQVGDKVFTYKNDDDMLVGLEADLMNYKNRGGE